MLNKLLSEMHVVRACVCLLFAKKTRVASDSRHVSIVTVIRYTFEIHFESVRLQFYGSYFLFFAYFDFLIGFACSIS